MLEAAFSPREFKIAKYLIDAFDVVVVVYHLPIAYLVLDARWGVDSQGVKFLITVCLFYAPTLGAQFEVKRKIY